MNSSLMQIQNTFDSKTFLTNVTFEWLFIFMNSSLMPILLFPKKFGQILHIKGFSFSFTVVWSEINLSFILNNLWQVSRLNGDLSNKTIFVSFRKLKCPKYFCQFQGRGSPLIKILGEVFLNPFGSEEPLER